MLFYLIEYEISAIALISFICKFSLLVGVNFLLERFSIECAKTQNQSNYFGQTQQMQTAQ